MSTTTIEFKTRFIMPAASLCYDVAAVRIPTKFHPNHPCHGPLDPKNNMSDMALHDVRRKQCENKLLYDYPYTDVFNNLTWDFMPLFRAMERYMSMIHWWKEYVTNEEEADRFASFYKPPRKCFMISFDRKKEYDMLNFTQPFCILHMVIRQGYIDRIPFQGHRAGPYDLYFHDARTLPRGFDQPVYQFDYQGAIRLTPIVRQVQYLPPPFRFECFDYDTVEEIVTREDCIEKCVRGKDPENIHQQLTFTEFPVSDKRKFHPEPKSNYESLYSKCSKECPLACTTKMHMASSNILAGPWAGMLMMVGHDHLTFETKYVEKLPFIEYGLYIASIIGLWIGFSVFDMRDYVKILEKCKKASKKTKSNEKSKKFLNIVFIAACFAGCIYQSIDVTLHYFEYEFHSEFKVIGERDDEIPTISFCDPFQFAYRGKYGNITLGFGGEQADGRWAATLYNDTLYDMMTSRLYENVTISELGINTGRGLDLFTHDDAWNSNKDFISKHTHKFMHNLYKCEVVSYQRSKHIQSGKT